MTTFADKARRVPGVAKLEGALNGAIATEQDLPIADYDKLSAEEIASRLKGFTQRDLRKIDAYERKRQNRATITDRIAALAGEEPWAGYDEQSVEGIQRALREAGKPVAREVREYERGHKDRAGVIAAADQRIQA
jgi:hypothetical protein